MTNGYQPTRYYLKGPRFGICSPLSTSRFANFGRVDGTRLSFREAGRVTMNFYSVLPKTLK